MPYHERLEAARTFTAFVVDNGPGAAQINLRGLGAERVLLLLNSRRLAPGGVGGAPTFRTSGRGWPIQAPWRRKRIAPRWTA